MHHNAPPSPVRCDESDALETIEFSLGPRLCHTASRWLRSYVFLEIIISTCDLTFESSVSPQPQGLKYIHAGPEDISLSSMEIPPGIRFLARVLPTLAAPPTLVFCILRLFQFYQAFAIPTWATILACVIAQPALAIASAYYTRHSDRADAAARGADLISEVHDRWPGGVSIIATIVRGLQSGYPGLFSFGIFGRQSSS